MTSLVEPPAIAGQRETDCPDAETEVAWLRGESGTAPAPSVLGVPRVPAQRVPSVLDAEQGLVYPPNDTELYAYLGPQRRWVQWLMSVAFILAASSLARFAGNSWFLWPLYAVLGLNVLGMVVSALSGWNRREFGARAHWDTVNAWLDSTTDVPGVDVFLPTCGEDLTVLRNTYTHVSAMEWEGAIHVWVLDDADRPEVADLAAEFGFPYIVRPDRGHMKKAGNLQHAFGLSEAEFVVIFDADFCPRPDYLMHLVPYMQDESVGIVQSPQYFSTTDSMSWLERTAGATQELFYRWVQPSRNALEAAICVGTCAVYRRRALESIGGFAQIEHSEDVHTGIFLLRAGHRTKYVPIVVAKGLCPEQLSGFLNQQYRWCNGSITLLNTGEAQRHPLTFRQRFCFAAGFLYYITTAVNVFAIHVPGLIMAAVYPHEVRPSHFVPFFAGLWVYFALMPRVSTAKWRFEVLRTQMAYSFCHALAIVHKLSGRTKAWVATGSVGKAGSLARTISLIGAVTISLTVGLTWVFVIRDVYLWGMADYWAMVIFLSLYSYIAAPLLVEFLRVLGVLPDRRERSAVSRRTPAGEHKLTRVEFAAITAVLLLGAIVASGAIDSALPWV